MDSHDEHSASVDRRPAHRPEHHAEASPLAWALTAVSAAVVLAVLGYLLYEGLASPSTPPDIRVSVEAVRPVGAGYLVEFGAENVGQRTAAQVSIVGTLGERGSPIESATATVDYVPAGAVRQGGLYFTENPEDYDLTLRATGFERP